MHARHIVYLYAVIIAAGTTCSPFISDASLVEDLRKIHTESREEREGRREQFKHDVLEKRQEMIAKWHGRKEEFKDKLKEEQNRIMSEFEIRRAKEKEFRSSSSSVSDIENKDEEPIEGIWAAIKKNAESIVHAFLPFKHIFGN